MFYFDAWHHETSTLGGHVGSLLLLLVGLVEFKFMHIYNIFSLNIILR